MRIKRLHLVYACALGMQWWSGSTLAQSVADCGDPPPVRNETLKGEIDGKAQALSKFIGDAQLTGRIETSRTEIFSKYPDAEITRGNAYFEYQVCILIMGDRAISNSQKLDKLIAVRMQFRQPVKQAAH